MGKYIKKFDTHLDYEDFIETEDFIRPNVSYCVDNKDVHYNSIQTLFALEIESGRFISFYFLGSKLYANTEEGSSSIWVLDANGAVVDNISYPIGNRAPILEQINEHYGTSFTGWSDNEIGLQLGDTVPNWNAYEKIGITPVETQFKFEFFGSYNFGDYINKKVRIGGPDETHFFNTTSEGEIESIGEFDENAKNIAKEFLVQYLGEIQNIEIKILTGLNVGDSIPNWEDYELLT